MTDPLTNLDVFYGDLTANRAYIYARLPRSDNDTGLTLSGQVRGPRCLQAETLPARFPLVDLGPGPTILAQAIVPEPCSWSPELPAIYDVTVMLQRGADVVATAHREIGLRCFGTRGTHLALAGNRCVLRGVNATSTTGKLPRLWHEASAVYVASDQDLERLGEASQWGALALVSVDAAGGLVNERLRTLAQFPAVAIAVMRGLMPPDFKTPRVAPNLLLAAVCADGDEAAVPSWADLLLVSADNPQAICSLAASAEIPVIAERRLNAPVDLATARAACDTLQRDLAPFGQFAGYIV